MNVSSEKSLKYWSSEVKSKVYSYENEQKEHGVVYQYQLAGIK